jgi:hypothetical protein
MTGASDMVFPRFACAAIAAAWGVFSCRAIGASNVAIMAKNAEVVVAPKAPDGNFGDLKTLGF